MKNGKSLYVMISGFFVFTLISFGLLGCEAKSSKSDKPLSDDGFKAQITVENPPTSMKANSPSTIKVRVKNISNSIWYSDGKYGGKYPLNLSYHWLDKDDKTVIEGNRTPLPHNIKPNEEIALDVMVIAPKQIREYILKFDMVQESVAWFEDKKSKTAKIEIKVE